VQVIEGEITDPNQLRGGNWPVSMSMVGMGVANGMGTDRTATGSGAARSGAADRRANDTGGTSDSGGMAGGVGSDRTSTNTGAASGGTERTSGGGTSVAGGTGTGGTGPGTGRVDPGAAGGTAANTTRDRDATAGGTGTGAAAPTGAERHGGSSSGATGSVAGATGGQSTGTGSTSGNLGDASGYLERGRNVAIVIVPASHGMPGLRVSAIHEPVDDWRIDIADNITGQQLRDNLKTTLTHIGDNSDKWPADVNEAYRHVAHGILMAIGNVPMTAATPTAGTDTRETR
jgi:hypothetical protein